MASNNLLLVFVCAVLSLCEARQHEIRSKFSEIKANAPEGFQDKVFYFNQAYINENGELIYDFTGIDMETYSGYIEVPFSSRSPFRKGTAITDRSFLAIPKEGFEDLKTSKPLNASEKENCTIVSSFYDQFQYFRLGYAAKAIENADIAPSVTYLLRNYPSKRIIIQPGEEDEVKYIDQPTCDDSDTRYTMHVVHKYGVVGTDCFPNTVIPSSTAACTETTGKYQKRLVGYKEGFFYGDNDAVKEALIKFGPIYVNYIGLIIGWEDTNWVTAEQLETTGGAELSTVPITDISPDVWLGFVYASVCDTITAETKKEGCACPLDKALHESDPRRDGICKCPAKGTPEYDNDPRTIAKLACASGSVRMTLGMIAAVVVIPVIALFF